MGEAFPPNSSSHPPINLPSAPDEIRVTLGGAALYRNASDRARSRLILWTSTPEPMPAADIRQAGDHSALEVTAAENAKGLSGSAIRGNSRVRWDVFP